MTDSEPKETAATPAPGGEPVAVPPPETILASPEVALAPEPPTLGPHWGTGRRKTAVARVRLIPGDGKFLINTRPVEQYFPLLRDQQDAVAPLELAGVRRNWDVLVNVNGGGVSGQAGAVRLGVARAVIKAYAQHELTLRDAGFLTRDSRKVERKKYGRRKARRRFQFSKR